MITALDHIQLAIPVGGEDRARRFWVEIMGMSLVPKPAELSGRGGIWLAAKGVQLHLGVEHPFSPALKAHPAFEVASLADLKTHLTSNDWPWTDSNPLPTCTRIFTADPFGNRIEFLQKT